MVAALASSGMFFFVKCDSSLLFAPFSLRKTLAVSVHDSLPYVNKDPTAAPYSRSFVALHVKVVGNSSTIRLMLCF